MAQFGADFGGSMPEYYDRYLGPAQFGAFAQKMAERLPQRPPGDALEIACGTGLVTRRLRERLAPDVRLVASDLSQAMLDYAKTKVPGDIEWRQADASALPFGDQAFGAVVCCFGVMFIPDKAKAFREMRRVLKPGGVLLFNVWNSIERNPHARVAAEVFEGMFPDDPDMRNARAPFQFYDRGAIRGLVEQAGFRDLRADDVRITISTPSARDYATGSVYGTPRSLLLKKRGVDMEKLIDVYGAALAKEGGAEPFRVEGNAIYFEARAV